MQASSSLMRSIGLAAVVALGIAAAWFTVAAFIIGATEQSAYSRGDYEQLYVRLDGEPVILKQTGLRSTSQQMLSLDRKPTAGDVYQILHPAYVGIPQSTSYVVPNDWTIRLSAVNDGGSPATYWYLVHDGRPNGLAYGIGYHSATKRSVGFFGREGFSERLPPRESWFQVMGDTGLAYATPDRTYYEPYWSAQPALYLLANGKLWCIDTRKRSVQSLTDCPDATAIGWAWRTNATLPDPADRPGNQTSAWTRRSLLVRTPEAGLLIDPDTGEVARYALPRSLSSAMLAACQLADKRLLAIGHDPSKGAERQIVWIDPEGTIDDERRIALASPSQVNSERMATMIMAIAGPTPPAQLLMLGSIVMQPYTIGAPLEPAAALVHALALVWPSLAFVLVISAVVAVAAYRRQRRFAFPGAVAWAVFAFIFGLPGWLAYRFHRVWPPLEECPACNQASPRDREACIECGADFPQPPLKGIEVFA